MTFFEESDILYFGLLCDYIYEFIKRIQNTGEI